MRISQRGANRVARQLAAYPAALRDALTAGANTIMNPLIADAQVYPAELPNQHYQRTYTLQAGWNDPLLIQRDGAGVTISAINTVEYSDEVQTAGQQKPGFDGRWRTTEMIANDGTPQVVGAIDRIVDTTSRRF